MDSHDCHRSNTHTCFPSPRERIGHQMGDSLFVNQIQGEIYPFWVLSAAGPVRKGQLSSLESCKSSVRRTETPIHEKSPVLGRAMELS